MTYLVNIIVQKKLVSTFTELRPGCFKRKLTPITASYETPRVKGCEGVWENFKDIDETMGVMTRV
jgi:hypothetical protein